MEGAVSEYQAAFTDALRGGRQMRKRVFDTIEQRHGDDFANGKVGIGLYENLLEAVRESRAPEAIEEFESRFFPLLNPDRPRRNADVARAEDLTDQDPTIAVKARRRTGWGGISVACLALLLGAFILGFNALKMTASEGPAITQAAAVPAVQTTTEVASEATTEPATAVAAETAAPKVMEPESDITSDGLRAVPAEQEAPAEDR
jgi:hypothetical protein